MSYDFTSWDAVLVHHGIKGQKHGVRRFQNEDGSLTAAGKARYSEVSQKVMDEARAGAVKAIKNMTSASTTGESSGGGSATKGPKATKTEITAADDEHTAYVKRRVAEAEEYKKSMAERTTKTDTAAKDAKKKKGSKGRSGKSKAKTPKGPKASSGSLSRSVKGPSTNLSKYNVSSSIMNKIHALLSGSGKAG